MNEDIALFFALFALAVSVVTLAYVVGNMR
jgi:hypothetical protein